MLTRFRRLTLFLVGFSIPIQGLSVSLGPIRATPFKLVALPLFVLAGVQLAFRSGSRTRDAKFFWVVAFGLSYVIAQAMSLLSGVPLSGVLRDGTTILALVFYYFLLGLVINRREDFTLFLWAIVLGGGFTVLPAALGLQAATAEFAYGERYQGLAGQENVFGAEMTVAFAVALGVFFASRSFFGRVMAVGGGALALAGVALSLSRAAFVSLGAMWVFWMYRSGRTGSIRYAVPALFLALAALLAAPESVQRRFETMVDPFQRGDDSSIQGRLVLGMWALRAMATSPVVGVGANRFPVWVKEQPGTGDVPAHTVHNAYLFIGAEQGLFGLIPFLAMLMLSWRDYSRCWRAARARRGIRDVPLQQYATYALYLQLGLLAIAVGGMFHQQHRLKSFWTLMALSPILLNLVRARLDELRAGGEAPAEAPSPHAQPPARPGLVPGHARVP